VGQAEREKLFAAVQQVVKLEFAHFPTILEPVDVLAGILCLEVGSTKNKCIILLVCCVTD